MVTDLLMLKGVGEWIPIMIHIIPHVYTHICINIYIYVYIPPYSCTGTYIYSTPPSAPVVTRSCRSQRGATGWDLLGVRFSQENCGGRLENLGFEDVG